MKNRKAAGLLYGSEEKDLDHLAPICALMQIPLIVTEEAIELLAKEYYPEVTLLYYPYSNISHKVVENYDILFSTLPRILLEEIFFLSQRVFNKRLHSIWVPHGNSDKGYHTPFIEGLTKEEIALVYGEKMAAFVQSNGAFNQLKALIFIGNLRNQFYKERKNFYQNALVKKIKLEKKKETILYAPTWNDSEQSSSFFSATSYLIDHLPEDFSLIIKLHPYLMEDVKTEQLLLKYEKSPQVQFIKQFPPIYPLLEACSIYVGDLSSIGYDALTFNKPMFFLNEGNRDPQNDPGLYLYRCGVVIPPNRYSDIYKLIEWHLPYDQEDFSKIRNQVYKYTFGEDQNWDALRQKILHAYQTLPDPDIDFI